MLTEKDYCDYNTCVALNDLGYNQSSIAFYPCQDIKVDCVDLNGDLYEAEYDKESLVLYSSLNNKNYDINKVQAPLLYEAQKWLREEKNIDISITISPFEYFATIREFVFWNGKYSFVTPPTYPNGAKTYEESLLEGIKEAVKILEKK